MITVPDAFAVEIVGREGDAGRAWLNELPSLVSRLCQQWDCTTEAEVWHGGVALVVPVTQGTTPAALKVSFPHPGNTHESAGLRCFAGRGAVRLLEADDAHFAVLMERGGTTTLAQQVERHHVSVDEAIEISGDLARRMAVPMTTDVLPLASTTAGWEGQLDTQLEAVPGLLDPGPVDRARQTIRLLSLDTTATMLHGDLHFGNVLAAEREPWLAIDPKGWSGDAAYDAFTVVAGGRDELQGRSDLYRAVKDRVDRFAAAAQIDPDLALACCQARAVSSYLYEHLVSGSWFDLELLEAIIHGR